jgi:hypothetical protein
MKNNRMNRKLMEIRRRNDIRLGYQDFIYSITRRVLKKMGFSKKELRTFTNPALGEPYSAVAASMKKPPVGGS